MRTNNYSVGLLDSGRWSTSQKNAGIHCLDLVVQAETEPTQLMMPKLDLQGTDQHKVRKHAGDRYTL